MNCPDCSKEVMPDSFFCNWCSGFIPKPGKGKKANLFSRWVALAIDPVMAVILCFLAIGVFGSISKNLGVLVAVLLPLGYFGWFLSLLRQGLTPGKMVMGLQVVDHQTGEIPGFGDVPEGDHRQNP